MHKLSYKLTLAGAAALLVFGGSALAHKTSEEHKHGKIKNQATSSVDPSASPTASPEGKGKGKGKAALADKKLAACEKREAKINSIMTRTVERATKQIGVFDKIADRVQEFAESKGKKPANFDELVLAVENAKSDAEADLTQLNTTATFNCDGTDPKGAASSFKSNLKVVISDLKAYKTAVKNLIVGVKSANGVKDGDGDGSPKPSTSSSPAASGTASPSASPSGSPSTTPSPTASPSESPEA
jgi:hypothetical protein